MKRKSLLLLIICLLCATQTTVASSKQNKSTLSLFLGEQKFILEKAKTPFEKRQGLMHRANLPKNKGMIFIYNHPQKVTFWMGYTKIPLDLIMIDKTGTVTDTFSLEVQKPRGKNESAMQYSSRMPKYESSVKILYAIEINQGYIKKLGIKKGDRISIPRNM